MEVYREWVPYIRDVYLPIMDSISGDYRYLPFPGTILDQPSVTMTILGIIQSSAKEALAQKLGRK